MGFVDKEDFYVIETVYGDGQYLCSYVCERVKGEDEWYVQGTTRNIHSKRVKKFYKLGEAKHIRDSLEGARYVESPRVLRISTKVYVEEV